MRAARGTVCALALVGLGATGCGDDGGVGGGAADEPQQVGDLVADAPELEVEAFDFGFSPDPLEITAGEPVNLVMRVTSGGHNLRIEGTDLRFPVVDEGGAVVTGLLVDEPGDYQMVCTVPGHEAAGMVATLEVR